MFLKENKSYYSFILNKKGCIIDDLIISKIKYLNNNYFYLVYNSSRKEQDENFFNDYLNEYKLLNNHSLISVQGPNAKNILIFLDDINSLSFMESKVIKFLDQFYYN